MFQLTTLTVIPISLVGHSTFARSIDSATWGDTPESIPTAKRLQPYCTECPRGARSCRGGRVRQSRRNHLSPSYQSVNRHLIYHTGPNSLSRRVQRW